MLNLLLTFEHYFKFAVKERDVANIQFTRKPKGSLRRRRDDFKKPRNASGRRGMERWYLSDHRL